MAKGKKKHLVIVESPAKAQTINKYLGSGYKVLASYGHVRDLVQKDGSVDPTADFAMKWELRDKRDTLGEIVNSLKKAKRLAEDSSWSEYMTWYLKVPEVFRVAEMPVEESVRRPQYRLTLDYPQDLDVIRQLMAELSRSHPAMTVSDVVGYLDAHPELAQLNAGVPSKPLPEGLNVRLRKEAEHAQCA